MGVVNMSVERQWMNITHIEKLFKFEIIAMNFKFKQISCAQHAAE